MVETELKDSWLWAGLPASLRSSLRSTLRSSLLAPPEALPALDVPAPVPLAAPVPPDSARESVAGSLSQAVALHRLGQLDEAMALYEALPSEDDGRADALPNMIAIAAARNDTVKLREYAHALLNLRRQSPSALAALMQAEMTAGDYKAAIQHGLRLVKHIPGSYAGWFNLGLCYQKTNHLEQAAQAYTEAIKIQPDSAPAHANMGAILHEHGDLSGARREYERALEIQPDNVGARWKRAIIQEKDGQLDQAEKVYSRLIRERSNVFGAAFRQGLIRLERKDYIAAAEAFELCLRERSDDPAAQINLSLAHWQYGDRKSAQTTLRQTLAKNPDSLPALGLCATLSIEGDDWEKASEIEIKLLELGEDTSSLAYNIGVLQQRQGLHPQAAGAFKRASDQRPGFVEALVNAGHSLKASGQADEAVAAWKAALEARPELADSYFKQRTASTAA